MRILISLSAIFLLCSCEGMFTKSIAEICEEYPQMCNDLNPDSWCRAEKSEIINHRYQNQLAPDDYWKYRLLLDFEDYKKCITKASGIEHIKLKEKKSGRVKGVMTAQRELQRLARDTEESNNPLLLHYHWSRFDSKPHLEKFLKANEEGRLETPEMQVALATYFIKYNQDLTLKALYHALELYKEDDEVDQQIFESLTGIYLKKDDFKSAYTWGYVAREYQVETLDLSQIEAVVRQVGGNVEQLADKAEEYIDAIQDGTFRSPL